MGSTVFAGEGAYVAPKKKCRTVQSTLDISWTPTNVRACVHAPPASQSHPAATSSGQEYQIATPPPPSGQQGPPTRTLVELGASLAEYVRLHRFRELQVEVCGLDAANRDGTQASRQDREEELRLECVELLGKLRGEVGCAGHTPPTNLPKLDSAVVV